MKTPSAAARLSPSRAGFMFAKFTFQTSLTVRSLNDRKRPRRTEVCRPHAILAEHRHQTPIGWMAPGQSAQTRFFAAGR